MLQARHLGRQAGLANRCTSGARLAAAPFKLRARHVETVKAAAAEAPAEAGLSPVANASVATQPVLDVAQQQALVRQQEAEELAAFQLAELDAAQEQLLAWVTDNSEEAQDEELDEAVDYDEFADAEYAEIYQHFEQMVESSYADIRVGDKVVGTVYEIDEDGAYVEVVGEKASGFVPLAECSFAKLKTPLEVLRVGMRREFVVVSKEDEAGQLVLSLAAMEASVYWERMKQMMTEGVVVTVKVESANKGGLLVHYGPFDGFVPVGQFGPSISAENAEELVGKQLPVKFLDVDEEGERLVFSAKQASGITTPTQDIKMGDVVEGVVQVVKPYGAFVDIGGLTGLLHVSQISNGRITNVEKLFAEGDRIKVMVLSLDRERGRITLSTKKLEPSAGDMLKNPQLVYERAEEMAAVFRERIKEAEQQIEGGAAAVPNGAADLSTMV